MIRTVVLRSAKLRRPQNSRALYQLYQRLGPQKVQRWSARRSRCSTSRRRMSIQRGRQGMKEKILDLRLQAQVRPYFFSSINAYSFPTEIVARPKPKPVARPKGTYFLARPAFTELNTYFNCSKEPSHTHSKQSRHHRSHLCPHHPPSNLLQ